MSKSQQNNRAQYRPEHTHGGAGEIGAIVSGIVSRIQTVTLVRVVKTKAGGLAPVGLADVQPLVAQISGDGTVTPHGIIYNVPYFRLQGGGQRRDYRPRAGRHRYVRLLQPRHLRRQAEQSTVRSAKQAAFRLFGRPVFRRLPERHAQAVHPFQGRRHQDVFARRY